MKKFPEAHDLICEESIHLTRDSLDTAIRWIDKSFGKDYAKQHPELLASFISATMTAYAGSLIAAAIQDSRGTE
jgi:hypothetical protein